LAQFLLISTLLTIGGLVATIVMGFLASPTHAAQHILLALVTVLVGLFAQSMTMFFFIGTGKEIKEKVKGAREEPSVVEQTRSFKSRVFPAAMYSIAVLMITFITGGGVATGKTPRWMHLILAFVTVVMYARAYWVQLRAMEENARLMEKYLASASSE
jgi:amino acid transporter